ncbi:MAG: MFS transporter [Streptosporangiales bacterium]|nr:MFS transporter [Streptosporangiales bacterium]
MACVAAASGPVAGGVLVDALGWRAVFWLNLPVAAAAVLVTVRHIAAARPGAERSRLDLAGLVPGVLCLLGLAYGLNEAGASGWTSPTVLGAFTPAAAAGAAFAAIEWRRERNGGRPVLPPSLFRRVPFTAAAAIGVLLNLGFYGMLHLVTLYFQEVRSLSATATGLALLPCMALGIVSSPLAGRIGARTGPYVPMCLGLGIGAAGFAGWLAAGPHTPYLALLPALMCCGFGTPLCMPAATSALLEAAPADAAGVASAVFNVARQTGSTTGVALFGSLAAARPVAGLHAATVIAAVLYAGGAGAAWAVGRRVRPS